MADLMGQHFENSSSLPKPPFLIQGPSPNVRLKKHLQNCPAMRKQTFNSQDSLLSTHERVYIYIYTNGENQPDKHVRH